MNDSLNASAILQTPVPNAVSPSQMDPAPALQGTPLSPKKNRSVKQHKWLAASIEARLLDRWRDTQDEQVLYRMSDQEQKERFAKWAEAERPKVNLKEEKRALRDWISFRRAQKKAATPFDYRKVLEDKTIDLSPYPDLFQDRCASDSQVHLRSDLWNFFLNKCGFNRSLLVETSQIGCQPFPEKPLISIPLRGNAGRVGLMSVFIAGKKLDERTAPAIKFVTDVRYAGWRAALGGKENNSFVISLEKWVTFTSNAHFYNSKEVDRLQGRMEIREVIAALEDQESEELSTTFIIRSPYSRNRLRFTVRTGTPYIGVKYVDRDSRTPDLWAVLDEKAHALLVPWIPHLGFAEPFRKLPLKKS